MWGSDAECSTIARRAESGVGMLEKGKSFVGQRKGRDVLGPRIVQAAHHKRTLSKPEHTGRVGGCSLISKAYLLVLVMESVNKHVHAMLDLIDV